MDATCLFVINGLGMGNCTRCHAVMEYLADMGCQIHVLTSGNGLTYFQDKKMVKSLTLMESFYYSGKNGGVSGWSTLKSISSLARIARAKRAQLAELLETIQPDVAVIDSEYSIGPLRSRNIPVVALNTSEMIVTEYLKSRQKPPGIRSHFWFVEFSDYLFHRHYCDLVLSPFPLPTPVRHPKFRRIGLIARKSIKEKAQSSRQDFPSPRSIRRVTFMLSGSVHASNIRFEDHDIPFKIDIVGRPGASSGNITYHGRQMDNTRLLTQADALVINGGYSAVSEAMMLGKPTFVVPVSGHAEQFVNANLVNDLGFGFVANETDVLRQLLGMYERNQWIDLKPKPNSIEIDGAQQASEAILATAKTPGAVHPSQVFISSCQFTEYDRDSAKARERFPHLDTR